MEDFEQEPLEQPAETPDDSAAVVDDPEQEPPAHDEIDDDEVIITLGDSPAPEIVDEEKAPEWVRELRKSHRELTRRNRELEEQVKAAKQPEQQAPVLGPKPTLEGLDYDTEAYEAALAKWYDDKRAADQAKAESEAQQRAEQEAWNEKLTKYAAAKASLKAKGFEDAEALVMSSLSQTQQGILLNGAEKPEHLVYALGTNPQRLKELQAITDPVKYAFALSKLEDKMKVTPRKAPPPEKSVSGSGPVAGSADQTLERLRAEAEKTGDRTKVAAYLRQKRRA